MAATRGARVFWREAEERLVGAEGGCIRKVRRGTYRAVPTRLRNGLRASGTRLVHGATFSATPAVRCSPLREATVRKCLVCPRGRVRDFNAACPRLDLAMVGLQYWTRSAVPLQVLVLLARGRSCGTHAAHCGYDPRKEALLCVYLGEQYAGGDECTLRSALAIRLRTTVGRASTHPRSRRRPAARCLVCLASTRISAQDASDGATNGRR